MSFQEEDPFRVISSVVLFSKRSHAAQYAAKATHYFSEKMPNVLSFVSLFPLSTVFL